MLSDRLQDLPTDTIFSNDEVGIGVDASTLVLLPKQNAVLDLGRNLLKAARQGNTAQVHDLMTKGAPFTTDWLGTSALHLAALNNHVETCEVLLRAGISKDSRTKVERTPLHLAAYEGHTKIVELLLNNKADVDPLDMLRMTPLHWAVEKQHESCIDLLLQHGADPNAISKFEKTPISIALEIERLDFVNLLNEAARVFPEREMLFRDESIEHMDPAAATESISYELQSDMDQEDDSNVIDENGEVLSGQNTVDLTETNETHKEIIVEPDILQDHDFDNNNMEDLVTATKLTDTKANNTASHISALQILQSHGITMLPADNGDLINNAIQSGRTVVLSEAGKMMLAESKKKPIKIEPSPIPRQKVVLHPHFKNRKIIRLTAEQILAMTNSNSPQKPNILKKVSAEAFKRAAQNSGVDLSSMTSPLKLQTKPKITYISTKDKISFSKNLTTPFKNDILNKDRTEVCKIQEKLDEALKRIKELEVQLEQKDKENKKLNNQLETLKSRSSHSEYV